MITSAIGNPTPNAPPIINANAESKFASARTIRPAMLFFRRTPRASPARRRINYQNVVGTRALTFSNQALPEPQRFQAEGSMVKKGLTWAVRCFTGRG